MLFWHLINRSSLLSLEYCHQHASTSVALSLCHSPLQVLNSQRRGVEWPSLAKTVPLSFQLCPRGRDLKKHTNLVKFCCSQIRREFFGSFGNLLIAFFYIWICFDWYSTAHRKIQLLFYTSFILVIVLF